MRIQALIRVEGSSSTPECKVNYHGQVLSTAKWHNNGYKLLIINCLLNYKCANGSELPIIKVWPKAKSQLLVCIWPSYSHSHHPMPIFS